jgi:hypothetical protein
MDLVSREEVMPGERYQEKMCVIISNENEHDALIGGKKNLLIGSYRGSFIPFEMAITRREEPTVISLMADNNCQRLLWWGGISKRDRPRVESEWINNWKRQDSSSQTIAPIVKVPYRCQGLMSCDIFDGDDASHGRHTSQRKTSSS